LSLISFQKTGGSSGTLLETINDYLLWYARDKHAATEKFHQIYLPKVLGDLTDEITPWFKEAPDGSYRRLTPEEKQNPAIVPQDHRIFRPGPLTSPGGTGEPFEYEGDKFMPKQNNHWKVKINGLRRVGEKNRLFKLGNMIHWKLYTDDFPVVSLKNIWPDTQRGGFSGTPLYAVQTNVKVPDRCILMTTMPGDLVLDITCGSGTTAFSAEKLGRRWVTCDTSRVAINVARQRLLSTTFEHYRTRNGKVSGNFEYKTVNRVTLKSLAYDLEPEKVELVDQPEIDKDAVRVCGPFEVMSLGRYSVEDWKGYVVSEPGIGEPAKLENYIEVICRLYRKDAAIQGANGLVHAVAETEKEKIAISVGPLSGRVTAKQINDAVQDAIATGILEVHVLGWAFEANVGEVKSQLESRGKVTIELIMIRPDTLAEGLKATQPEMLFSPLALPDIEVNLKKNGKGPAEAVVTLKGVALFDRKHRRTEYKDADSGYVSAWYLDEDYDGDCFVDCQMFFDFKKVPNLKAALKAEIDTDEYALQLASQPFPVRGYKRIAVKVVDVYGNESTIVRELV